MAGMDNTLLALAGSGHSGGHSFGFASCERAVGASEGINVLVQQHVPSRRKGEPCMGVTGEEGGGPNLGRSPGLRLWLFCPG